MNRAALLTVGRKLQGDNMYLLSVFDLEPSGVIVHAYNQADSKEYILPITELEVICVILFCKFYFNSLSFYAVV